jgi:co-chaperonin GroES (HSP10)
MVSETNFSGNMYENRQKGHKVISKINVSGLKPFGHAVLVEPYEPEINKGVIAIPDTVSERTRMVETRARIIDIGPSAWDDEEQPRALPGQIVLISKYDGTLVIGPKDGKHYRLVNDKAIYCGVEV